VQKRIIPEVKWTEFVSDRILRDRRWHMIVLNVQAPTADKIEEELLGGIGT
jgi:hypothetical protein